MRIAYLVIIITFLNFSYLIAAENEYVIKENNYGVFSKSFIDITSSKNSSKCKINLNKSLLFEETCNSEKDIKLIYFTNFYNKNSETIYFLVFNINNTKLLIMEFNQNITKLKLRNKSYIEWDNSIPEIIANNSEASLTIKKYANNKEVLKYKYKNGSVSKGN